MCLLPTAQTTLDSLLVFPQDILTVCAGLVVSALLPVAVMVFSLWAQTQQTQHASADLTVFAYSDLFLAPWNAFYRHIGPVTVTVRLVVSSPVPALLRPPLTVPAFAVPEQIIVICAVYVALFWFELFLFISARHLGSIPNDEAGKPRGPRNPCCNYHPAVNAVLTALRTLLQITCTVWQAILLSACVACEWRGSMSARMLLTGQHYAHLLCLVVFPCRCGVRERMAAPRRRSQPVVIPSVRVRRGRHVWFRHVAPGARVQADAGAGGATHGVC